MEKLDPQLLELIQSKGMANGGDQPVSLMIQFVEAPSEAQIAELNEMGIKTRSVTGTIVTATVPRNRLESLSSLESVKYIEGPGTLTLE